MLIELGFSPLEIANRLGHEKVETTLNTYSHLYPNKQTKLAERLDREYKVAKECTNYGQRVQNSVFECQMDATKSRQVKNILENIIDKEVDSLRFYYLGEKYKNKVEHIGAKPGIDVTDTLIL